jgi:hypothetical protein
MHPKEESQHGPWENQSSPKRTIWLNYTRRFGMRSNATLTKIKPQKSFAYTTCEKKSSRYKITAQPIYCLNNTRVGGETAAQNFGLEFIPLRNERDDFIMRTDFLNTHPMASKISGCGNASTGWTPDGGPWGYNLKEAGKMREWSMRVPHASPPSFPTNGIGKLS